jgi:hypothetical protein
LYFSGNSFFKQRLQSKQLTNTIHGAWFVRSGISCHPFKMNKNLLLGVHGALMTTAWAVLATAGIFIARYNKNENKWWFRVHIALFIVSILFIITGFVVAVAAHGWSLHFHDTHNAIGVVLVVGVFIQPVLGFIADKMFNPNRLSPPVFPDQIHWYIGRVLYIMALFNIYLGLEMFKSNVWVKVAYYFWVVLIIAVFAFKKQPVDRHGGMSAEEHEVTELLDEEFN